MLMSKMSKMPLVDHSALLSGTTILRVHNVGDNLMEQPGRFCLEIFMYKPCDIACAMPLSNDSKKNDRDSTMSSLEKNMLRLMSR